jgi:hypothetical protein
MATTPTVQIVSGGSAKVVSWTGLANGQSGDQLEDPLWADRSVQVNGAFGVAGAVTIEGSNDGINWNTLTDPQGNNLIFTTSKIETVIEIVRYIRPTITAGDGSTSLNVILFQRGNV